MKKPQNKFKNNKTRNHEQNGNTAPKNFRHNNYLQQVQNYNEPEVEDYDLNNEEPYKDENNSELNQKEKTSQKPSVPQRVNNTVQKVKATTQNLKTVISFFMKHKVFLIIALFLIIIIIIVFIVALDILGKSYTGKGSDSGAGGSELLATYTNCDYITVDGEQIEFETYVAGVVTAENGDPNFPEAMKAQAVAARSYALHLTNNCEKSILNGQDTQVYKSPSEAGIAAAQATAGEILEDESGDIIPANYASFPDGNTHDWSYGACDNVSCTDTKCSTTLYRIPSGTKITFEMDKYYNGTTWNGSELNNQSGHCYGMSQLGARYLDTQGYSYKEILGYFYDYKASNMFMGFGLLAGSIDGYTPRMTQPTEDDVEWTTENAFYNSKHSLIGQCTWYTHGRSLEILKNSGLSDEEFAKAKEMLNNMRGNAGTWYDANKKLDGKGFAYGSEPKVGSIVVWASGSGSSCDGYGHVGIVEGINYNEDGTYKSLMISDGWKSQPWDNNTSWDSVNFRYRERTWDLIQKYDNGCRVLKGFIYLLDEGD